MDTHSPGLTDERYRFAFESANDGVCLVSIDGKFLEVNRAMCEMLGYTREELLLKTFNEVTYPPDMHIGDTFLGNISAGRIEREKFEKRYVRKSGLVVWAQVASSLVRDASGNALYLISHIEDITGRKEAERLLRESEHRYRTLFDSAGDAIFLMREGIFIDCNAKTLDMYRVSAAQILGHRPAEFSPSRQPDGKDSLESSVEKINAALAGNSQFFEWKHLRGDGTLFDAEVSLTRLTPYENSPDLLAIVRDITDRKREERALRESEERFQKIFHASPVPMSISRLRDGKYLDVNESFTAAMEYDRSEIIGDNAVELNTWADPEERKQVAAILRERGTIRNFEGRYRTKTGRVGHSIVSAELIELEGEPFILGVTLDITERKQMEEALKISEEKFSKAFLNAPVGISLSTMADGQLIEVNREFERIFGYTRSEAVGRRSSDLGLWVDAQDREDHIRSVAANGTVSDSELRLRSRDGSLHILRTNAQAIELNGALLLLSTFIDVTERKRMEEALRKSEERYRALVENTPDVIARFDKNRRYTFVNSAVKKVSSFKPEEFPGKTVWDVDFTHQQAKERDELIAKVLETGNPVDAELTFTGPTGPRTYEWRGFPELDENGSVQSLVTINRDITQRKLAEENLKASMEQLHELARRLEQVREEERRAISHEVHDELGQILTAVKMDLSSLKKIGRSPASEFEEKTKSLLDLTDLAIESVQDIAARLRPGMLDYLGLLAAVEWQVEDFQKRSGVKCLLHAPDQEPVLDGERATALFRILQEALTNVARHARATSVDVTLFDAGNEFVMTVADNGVGISHEQINGTRSFGLLGMRERLHPFKGICTIESPKEGGTTVTVRFPRS